MLTTRNHSDILNNSSLPSTVIFDLDTVTLEGCYRDEISAFRAKKVWEDTFQNYFLLEKENDFQIDVHTQITEDAHISTLHCEFISACARYAFWRLSKNQAQEAKYTIETAHIPISENTWLDFQNAPDAVIIDSEHTPLSMRFDEESYSTKLELNTTLFKKIESVIHKITTSLETSRDKKE